MPLYAYQVLDQRGALSSGKLEAENEFLAAARLKRQGFTPLELKEAKVSRLQQALTLKKRVGLGEMALFSRQMASMLSAGIPLTRCLTALGEQTVNLTLRKALLAVSANVEGGGSFSESLRGHPEIFNEMYCDLVKAGEVGGTLEVVLLRLSQQLESEKALKDNIKAAMFYPITVLVFASLVMTVMLIFIVPVFLGFYPEGTQLPFLTSIIVLFSNSLRMFWYFYILLMMAAVFAIKYYLASESGKRVWDRTKFRIPIFGALVQKTIVARFSRTLSTLLSGGIPVLQALETAGPASGSILVAEAVKRAGEKIQEGQSIAEPLKESKLFPPTVTLMVAVGEETGDLPSLLTGIAEFYEQEVATMSKGLTGLIEPLMIIFVGGIVGVMVLALYLPIFSVITQI
ncbi:MAG: type II secretion system F family protein [Dethiobacter sp.]|nr:type II secretion system F family protein [Dethiobacter sp.]MCL4464044.1 type II secretion system F family protein [Bacillota bacterium]MCL5993058.1 type II secretion system F family protein [Bacillota bacterium]